MVDEEHHTFLIFAQHGVERGIVCRTHPSTLMLFALFHVPSDGRIMMAHKAGQGVDAEIMEMPTAVAIVTELRVEHTRSTAHKRHGDKHRHEHAGPRDDGHRHIADIASLVAR